MSCILLSELQNMIVYVKESGVLVLEEVSRIEQIIELEKNKHVLKTMISFIKRYMDKCCVYLHDECNCLNYSYVYGGFIRDWCMPCLNENLDCMEESSVDVMFLRHPKFEIPRDIDIINRYGFHGELMEDIFSFLKEDIIEESLSYNNSSIITTLTINTSVGMTFTIDINEENMRFDSRDFDVNRWMFKPCCGVYNNDIPLYLSQRVLIKTLKDVKDKRCFFIGKFEITQNKILIEMRKNYIDRIKKMISKGWTVTNLSSSLSFLGMKEVEEGNCMICQELSADGDKRVRISCCSYVLHMDCFFDWMKSSMEERSFARCLTCERTFTPIEYLKIIK